MFDTHAHFSCRDERWERLQCDHKGTYADDCIVDRVMKQRVYLVATNDRDLKRRIRKVPGVPILSVARGKYVIERYVSLGMITTCRIRRAGDCAGLLKVTFGRLLTYNNQTSRCAGEVSKGRYSDYLICCRKYRLARCWGVIWHSRALFLRRPN